MNALRLCCVLCLFPLGACSDEGENGDAAQTCSTENVVDDIDDGAGASGAEADDDKDAAPGAGY